MKFSALISVYKKENPVFFKIAIESILNQSLMPSEIVIVKDGILTESLDAVIETFVLKHPDLFFIVQLDENKGLGKALAIGVEACNYEYIARMDSDDICAVDRFETQIEFMIRNPTVDVCGMWIEEFGQEIGDIKSLRKVPELSADIWQMLKKRNPMNHVTVMLKKDSVLKVNNYEGMTSYEDYYLWAKMLKNGCEFANISKIGVYVRVGNNMIGRRVGLIYYKSEYVFFKKLYEMNVINIYRLVINMFIRLVRFLPMPIIREIYKNLLR